MHRLDHIRLLTALALAGCFGVSPAPARAFYASPTGTPSADGGFATPWDLQTALSQPRSISPGDTIWLRGGTYRGVFTSDLTGTPGAPIIVRQYPGERAVIDGPADAAGGAILTINGASTWYWDFEVTCSDRNRQVSRATGLNVFGPDTRFINLIVHDTGQGFGFWTPATDAEIYGSLIYNNGFDAPDRGHGHGVYAQNKTGVKHLQQNVLFNQFSHGIHVYTEGGSIDNFEISENVSLNNGAPSRVSGPIRNILVGGGQVASNIVVTSNYTYFPLNSPGDNNLGYSAGCNNATVRNNYLAGAASLALVNCQNVTMNGNYLIGATMGFSSGDFPRNFYMVGAPASNRVAVLPNRYDPNRATIVVYNWEHLHSVHVDLAGLAISKGDCLELRNAQNYTGERTSAIYPGGGLEIPMRSWTVASPVGYPATASTFPEFGVFVVVFATPDPGYAPAGRGGTRSCAPRPVVPRSPVPPR